jgi:hypothetical protein
VWETGEVHIGLSWGDLKDRRYLEEESVDKRIILKWMFKKWGVGMEWVDLAQDRDRWRALVNAVTKIRVP